MIIYVERDQSNKVKTACLWPQGNAREPLPEDAPEVIEFRTRKLAINIKLTEAEKIKLIDFYVTNRIITPERATELKG